jgi:YjbE family integral membrane protein
LERSLFGALLSVLFVNLVLSGDNAVVIGLAAKDLGQEARRRAVLIGGGLAVALRLALTLPAEFLLRLPMVRAGGGGLLALIAYRLMTEESAAEESEEASSIAHAVRLIVIADLTMSLDNVLAVAAVAERSDHQIPVLIFGLALSIPLVLFGGHFIAGLMERLPVLTWIGGAILSYTAGELITRDKLVEDLLGHNRHLEIAIAIALAIAIMAAAAGKAIVRSRVRAREQVLSSS